MEVAEDMDLTEHEAVEAQLGAQPTNENVVAAILTDAEVVEENLAYEVSIEFAHSAKASRVADAAMDWKQGTMFAEDN